MRDPYAAGSMSLVAGASWIAVLSSLNVSAQTALPDWVRARGLSVFVTVFFGAMSAGSLIWGQAAVHLGIPTALVLAAAGAVAAIPLTFRWKLGLGETLDHAPSAHWPAPVVDDTVTNDRGPVLVTVEYRIEPASAAAFVAAMDALEGERRRDGAHAWGLFEDTTDPGRYLEYFLVGSWLEHRRQHERVARSDADLQAVAHAFHVAPDRDRPVVRHFVAPVRG